MPSRASVLLIRLPMRVRSPTRFSGSRLGRLASSSSRLGDRRHAALFPLAAQPAEKGSFQQCRVEPIGLRPAMFTRNGNAVRLDHIGFDGVRPQPAGQPEAVAPRLERDRDPVDIAPDLLRFATPAMQQLEQSCFVRVQLLCRVALDSRNNAGDEPARLAHLDHCDQRAILVESGEQPAQVIRLSLAARQAAVNGTTVEAERAVLQRPVRDPARVGLRVDRQHGGIEPADRPGQ